MGVQSFIIEIFQKFYMDPVKRNNVIDIFHFYEKEENFSETMKKILKIREEISKYVQENHKPEIIPIIPPPMIIRKTNSWCLQTPLFPNETKVITTNDFPLHYELVVDAVAALEWLFNQDVFYHDYIRKEVNRVFDEEF